MLAKQSRLPACRSVDVLLDDRAERFAFDWFEQEVGGPFFDRFGHQHPIRMTGEENHLRPGITLLGVHQHFHSIDIRHFDIADQQVTTIRGNPLLRLLGVGEIEEG